MRADGARRRMVGKHGNRHGFIPRAECFDDGPYDAAVEVLDGTDFQLRVAFVPRLVACLDVQVDEIIRPQGFQGGSGFPFVVRIVQARRTCG